MNKKMNTIEKNRSSLDQKIFAAFSISNKKITRKTNTNEIVNLTNLIYSTVITSDYYYKINVNTFIDRLQFLNCKEINVYYITAFGSKYGKTDSNSNLFYQNRPSLKSNLESAAYKNMYTFSDPNLLEFFRDDHLINKLFKTQDKNSELNKSIFIFEGIPWALIVACFYCRNILVTSGSLTKRGILSSVHYRLAQFMTCVEGMKSDITIINSFHNYYSLVSQPLFDFSILDKKNVLNFTHIFFKYLEEYFIYKKEEKISELRDKRETNPLEIIDLVSDKSYSLTKDLKFELDYKEFIDLYEDKIISEVENNKNEHLINENNKTLTNNNLNNQKREYHTSTMNYNSKNLIITPPHSLYKSSLNTNIVPLKKYFHSSSQILNSSSKKMEISKTFSSYLKSIQTIINDKNLNVSEIQLKIEKNWMKIITQLHEDPEYLEKKYSHGLKNKLFDAHRSLINIVNSNKVIRKFPTIYPVLNQIELLMISFGISMTGMNCNMGYNYITEVIGRKIILYLLLNNLEVLIKHNNLKISKEEITYQNFLETFNLNKMQIFSLGDFFLDILSHFPSEIFERKFNEKEGLLKNEPATLVINPIHFEEIKNNLIVEPSSLPMICKPKEWNDDKYGGYLTNNIVKDGIVTGSIYHGHQTKYKENLYKAINYMSSIKFRINTNLLNYLLNEGSYLLEDELIDQSEELQRITTLQIAETYKNIPFYLPLQCDWRSRIYVKPFFINYQGGDLSLALIEYWNGEILNNRGIDNLYIYGANAYNQKNISKDTYNNRINWVKFNMKNILKMEPKFMIQAENKYLFAAFCLTIRELEKDSNHLVNLPIFLDCTCSGIQHLAALMRDFQLANEVNLVPQNDDDVVSDIYSSLRKPINEQIRFYGRENNFYSSLANINLERKHIKKPIMTKTYNVTIPGITEQLSSMFPKIIKKINDKEMDFYLLPSIIKGEKIEVNFFELGKISEIINNIIFQTYPSLSLIYSYFINMTKVLNKLGIPVIWFTPSGLEIIQKYHISKQNKTSINFAGRTKKMVLREWTTKINKTKQCTAIIPNIIHSLDSAHLINLINRANINNINNVITVHDCFGTSPNSLHKLAHLVKIEFIKLYTDSNFLEKFHERNKQNILDNNFNLFFDEITGEEYVLLKRTKHYLPIIPKLGKLDLNNIIHSKHMLT